MFTRSDFSIAVFHAIGNTSPHPWMVKYLDAWGQIESVNPQHYALHNLLNTTEPGYGCDLLPEWNTVHVRQYPTFEDGVAATAHSLIGGVIHYYPVLLDALRTNNGVPLQHPTHELANELNTWGTGHALDIANLANSGNLRSSEQFPGRHAGQP